MLLLEDVKNLKISDLTPIKCGCCSKVFYKKVKEVRKVLNGLGNTRYEFCSRECGHKKKHIQKNCIQCGDEFDILLRRSFNGEGKFCSRSCAATYNNTHKTKGTRRSKLESWLEIKLQEKYPNLKIDFNKKDVINSELDIYFPDLKLAFELNGIFHYEPIYGQEKLDKIKNNDHRKFAACAEKGVSLCIIDTSKQSYFKEKTCFPFLDIIVKIVDQKLLE